MLRYPQPKFSLKKKRTSTQWSPTKLILYTYGKSEDTAPPHPLHYRDCREIPSDSTRNILCIPPDSPAYALQRYVSLRRVSWKKHIGLYCAQKRTSKGAVSAQSLSASAVTDDTARARTIARDWRIWSLSIVTKNRGPGQLAHRLCRIS